MAVEIEVVVKPDGSTTVEVDGMQGPGCSVHVGAIMRALDGEVVKDEKKPEFYQTTQGTSKVQDGRKR